MSRNSHYSLANHSQRRRRLILNRSVSEAELPPLELARLHQPIVDLSANIPLLREQLSHPQPLKWLILGDSLLPPSSSDYTPRGFVDVFRDYLNGPLWRIEDIVINGTSSRFKITEARDQLDFQLWRNRPDIIVLMCGPSDAEGGTQHCEAFEEEFIKLIKCIQKTGLNTIINTPPCLPETNESLLVDRLVYLEALKAISAEYDIPLVDHWKHWEWAAIEVGGTESWYQSDLLHPGVRGFEQMTHLLFKECGLEPIHVS